MSKQTIPLPNDVTNICIKQKNGEIITVDLENVEEIFFEDDKNEAVDVSTLPFLTFEKLSETEAELKSYDTSFELDFIGVPAKILMDGKEYIVTSIGKNAFSGSGLTSIDIPINVTNIGNCAFSDCSGLTTIEIPSNVTTIGDYTFLRCSELLSIDIPSKVTNIGECIFAGCKNLSEINVAEDNLNFCSENGVVYDKKKSVLISISPFKKGTFSIPSSVTKIGRCAFMGCDELSNIEIPSSVTTIEDSAFYECSGLTSIKIPASVTSIEDEVFYGCWCLKNIEIPSSVTNIGKSTFYGCYGLSSVILPNSLASIKDRLDVPDDAIVVDASTLPFFTFLKISGTEVELKSYDISYKQDFIEIPAKILIDGNIYTVTSIGEGAFFWCHMKSIVFPSSIKKIGNGAFFMCDLRKIRIPSSVISIGKQAFSYCSWLTNIEISSGVTSIGDQAFFRCCSLKSIRIPSSVTSIGHYAFSECNDLTSIEIPSSITFMGEGVLNNCNKLKSIILPYYIALTKEELDIPDNLIVVDTSSLPFLNFIKISETEAELKEYDFSYKQECVEVPAKIFMNDKEYTVSSIGKDAFNAKYSEGNKILKHVEIPSTIRHIRESAFSECHGLTSIKIPSNVTTIGDYAFLYCCNLTSIEIPSSVTSIGKRAFSGCKKLSEINASSDNPNYLSENGVMYNKNKTSIICVPALTNGNFSIPTSVTRIADSAFLGCSNLTNVEIPASVKTIGNYAFAYCSGLTNIKIPASVTIIGDYAFRGCSGLKSAIFPKVFETYKEDLYMPEDAVVEFK